MRTRRKTIPLSDIRVPKDFTQDAPNPRKVIEKTIDYCNGKRERIYVDRNNVLFDGYITYLILLQAGEVKAKCVVAWEHEKKKKGEKNEPNAT